MPYVQDESLREKLDREKQLAVDEAVGPALGQALLGFLGRGAAVSLAVATVCRVRSTGTLIISRYRVVRWQDTLSNHASAGERPVTAQGATSPDESLVVFVDSVGSSTQRSRLQREQESATANSQGYAEGWLAESAAEDVQRSRPSCLERMSLPDSCRVGSGRSAGRRQQRRVGRGRAGANCGWRNFPDQRWMLLGRAAIFSPPLDRYHAVRQGPLSFRA